MSEDIVLEQDIYVSVGVDVLSVNVIVHSEEVDSRQAASMYSLVL